MAVSFFSLIMLASTALADIDVGCDAGNASSGECFDAAPKQPRAGTAMMQVKANPSSQDFASTVLLEQAHAKVNKKPPSIPGKDPVKFYQTWAMDPPVEEGNFEYVYYGKKRWPTWSIGYTPWKMPINRLACTSHHAWAVSHGTPNPMDW